MKTTLKAIRANSPCESGWRKLLSHLKKTKSDDEPLLIRTILKSNGLDDALWCLRAVSGHDREIRLFAVWCARQVEHLNTDPRVKNCNDIAEKFANGLASADEMAAARDAAWEAAREAAWAAWAAAWAAARDAAWEAAWAAAREAQSKELIRLCKKIEKEES